MSAMSIAVGASGMLVSLVLLVSATIHFVEDNNPIYYVTLTANTLCFGVGVFNLAVGLGVPN